MLVAGLLLALVFTANGEEESNEPRACSKDELGRKSRHQTTHYYMISEGLEESVAILLPDPDCSKKQTVGLSLEVCDYDKEPSVSISSDKSQATIKRTGDKNGIAYVSVNIYCKEAPGRNELPDVREDFELTW